jgi:DMSO reductase anchor subunit
VRREWGEAPLVAFTSLAIAGAGLIAARPLLVAFGLQSPEAVGPELVWGGLAVGAGLLVSLTHLGRPRRLHLAARGAGRSALSHEVLLAAALIVSVVVASGVERPSSLSQLSGALALALLISVGFVYRLPGQATWLGGVVWSPALLGVALGVALVAARAPDLDPRTRWLILGPLLADAVLLTARGRALSETRLALTPAHPGLFRRRHQLLVLRGLLANLAPVVLVLVGRDRLAVALLLLGLVADRVAFYGLAAQHTTEAEIRRVEGVIDRLGP